MVFIPLGGSIERGLLTLSKYKIASPAARNDRFGVFYVLFIFWFFYEKVRKGVFVPVLRIEIATAVKDTASQ